MIGLAGLDLGYRRDSPVPLERLPRDLTAASDKSFRESVMTFRRMSVKESAGVKPLHIRVIAAKADDTIETLAQRMATDHKLERFLLLNGFQSHDKLKPGQKVKVVME